MTAPRLARSVGSSIFGTDIAGYQSARMGYPDELYQTLRDRCGSSVASILEIGPGTGLATFDLIKWLTPNRLVGVEADAELARHLQTETGNSPIEIVHSRFEQFETDAQFDLACCAAAFHWLEPETAFRKLRHLVRPGGRVALWWNSYRQAGIGDAFADAMIPLLAETALAPSEGPTGHYSLDRSLHEAAMTKAGLTNFESHIFRRDRTLTTEQVVALYASYSYVRALPDQDMGKLLSSIANLADEQFDGQIQNSVLTAIYLAEMPHRR